MSAAALGSVVCPMASRITAVLTSPKPPRCSPFSNRRLASQVLSGLVSPCSRTHAQRPAPPHPRQVPGRKEVRPHLRILPLAHPHPGGEAVPSSPALSLPKVLQTFRLLPLQTVRAGGRLHLLPTQRALGVLQQASVESDMCQTFLTTTLSD